MFGGSVAQQDAEKPSLWVEGMVVDGFQAPRNQQKPRYIFDFNAGWSPTVKW
jgi:hypothetical protein